MTRHEWEYMCERLKLVPDTLTQVDRYGRVIGGPWRFLDSAKSHAALTQILEYMTERERKNGPDRDTVIDVVTE